MELIVTLVMHITSAKGEMHIKNLQKDKIISQPNTIIAWKNYFVLYFERSHPQNVNNMKANIRG